MTFANGPADLGGSILGGEEAGSETSCTSHHTRRIDHVWQTAQLEELP